VLGVGLAQIPSLARLTQTLGASLVARDYVRAASLLGFGRRTVFARHVLPHVAGPLAIHATLVLGLSLVAISTLSFLGVGLQTPDYDWGLLVSNGQTFIATNPMAAIGPALFIVVTGVMFAGVGESIGLRRAIIVPVPRRAQRSGRRTSPASLADAGQAASVRDLVVQFDAADIVVEAVRGVSLSVPPGGRVGLVGESGSGKTLTARAIAGLLPPQARIAGGSVFASGIDMANPVGAGRVDLARACSMVFQDPNTALNPALRIGTQLTECVRHQSGLSRRAARQLAIETLEAVQIHDATGLLRKYPHELSGGMRQRVCIAIAVMSRPALVVADEPTTALDNVVQKEVLSVLDVALTTTSAALLLIAHDLAVVAQLCDEIYVMRDGVIVEHGTRDQVLYSPRDNYTRALLEAQPRMGQRRRAPGSVG
jgi:peptide/nickel transport system permease protein